MTKLTGDDIRRAREARGLTQQELAKAIGVGMRTVGAWERGENVPRNRMGMLRQFFGLDAGDEDVSALLRRVSELDLLGELMRRASLRAADGGGAAGGVLLRV